MKDLLPGEFSIREKDIKDRLKSVVQDIKELGYTISASQVKDTDALGGLVSKFCKWNGDNIYEVSYRAFEDSNYHSFNRKFEKLWNEPDYEEQYNDLLNKYNELTVKYNAAAEQANMHPLVKEMEYE